MVHGREVGFEFTLRAPNGATTTLLVDASSALIGSAAHCEVRLPREHAAHEHVEVMAIGEEVHIVTRSGEAPPLLGGMPFVSGLWPYGAVLMIGETAMTVRVVDLSPHRRTRSPFWPLASVPVLAGVAIFVATRSAPAADLAIPPAPALLDPPVVTCPVGLGPTLPAYAAERARVGLAKRERSPFSPSDGVEAVALLETASACYRIAGHPDAERETLNAARTLRARLEEEYHVRRVRVEHAYKTGDPFGAKRELTVLVPMIAHRRGPYVDWLGSVDRYANQALDQRSTRKL